MLLQTAAKETRFRNSSLWAVIPPSRVALTTLRLQQPAFDVLLTFLKSLTYFKSYSLKKIGKWLENNATDDPDLYLDDLDLQVRPVSLLGSLFDESLPNDKKEQFLHTDEMLPLREIYQAIRAKNTNTRARHHTLVFRPSIWTVQAPDQDITEFNGLIFDFDRRTLQSGHVTAGDNEKIVVIGFDDSKMAVLLHSHPEDADALARFNKSGLLNIVREITGAKQEDIDNIAKILSSLGIPSFHKITDTENH